MEISPATLALITTGSALLGVIVTSYFNLRAARINKESEERKHLKGLVFNAAIENWKQTYELMKTSGLPNKKISPLDVFLVHMVALSDVIFDPKLTPENIKQRLVEVDRMTEIVASSIQDIQPRSN